MPIALDPSQVFPISLASDEDKTPKPAFLFPAVTIRTQRKIFQLADSWQGLTPEQMESMSEFEMMDATTSLFDELVAGWEHITDREGKAMTFSQEAAEDILTTVEMWELLHQVRHNSHVSHDEKKS